MGRVPAIGRKPWVALAAVAGLVLCATAARANGRFPRSERLLEDPSNPQHLLLSATYGVLSTTDRGKHWYDYCEGLFAGDPTYNGDPLIDFVGGANGAPLAALVDVQTAISRTSDFCGWSPTFGSFQSTENVNDFAVDRMNHQTVVAVVTSIAEGGLRIGLQESTDAGVTWRAIGSPLPLVSVATIDLDPTDPTHIYATGLVQGASGEQGVLLQSHDHGATWVSAPIPNTDDQNVPFIAVIHPQDPKKIFVRTDATIFPVDAPEKSANDALLYSSDGGATWKEVLRQSAKLLGFALSPDGTTVLAGYGDPVESGVYVDPTVTGIYTASVASASSMTFAPIFSGSVTCLTWTKTGVYACTAEQGGGTVRELAFFGAGDLVADGGMPADIMQLDNVLGPVPCCPAAAAACDWSSLCVTYQFFACGDAAVPAVSCVDAGTPSTGADASSGGDDAGSGFPAGGHGACSCVAVGSPAEGAARWVAAVSLLAVGASRRRRRR